MLSYAIYAALCVLTIDNYRISDKKGLTAIECAVGFSVIPHPTTGTRHMAVTSYWTLESYTYAYIILCHCYLFFVILLPLHSLDICMFGSPGALTTTLPSSSHLLIERLTKEMVIL